jgi:hypothetical protein
MKIYLHTSQLPEYIEYMMGRHPSVIADLPKDRLYNLCTDLRRLPDKSHFWEQWRYLTESLIRAEERVCKSVTVEAWLCQSCYGFNIDDPAHTALPLCEHCDASVDWDDAWLIVFDLEEADDV